MNIVKRIYYKGNKVIGIEHGAEYREDNLLYSPDEFDGWFVTEVNADINPEFEALRVHFVEGKPAYVYQCKEAKKYCNENINRLTDLVKAQIVEGSLDVLTAKPYVRKIFMGMDLTDEDRKELAVDFG